MHSLIWRTSKFIHSWHILLNLYKCTGLYWLYDPQRQQWFAQSRQWEGTDVIQEMIHSAGSIIENEDGTISDEIDEGTPILLFCRNLGVVRLFDLIFFFYWQLTNILFYRDMFIVDVYHIWHMHRNVYQYVLYGNWMIQRHWLNIQNHFKI